MREKRFSNEIFVKMLLVAALAVFSSAPAEAQRVMNDRELYGLKGSVLTVIASEVPIVNENGVEIEKSGKVFDAREYDASGNTVKSYDSASNLVRIYNNADGAKTFLEMSVEQAEKYLSETKKKAKNKSADRRNEKFDFKWQYEYDDGRIVEQILLTKDGAIKERSVYEYDTTTLEFRPLKTTVYRGGQVYRKTFEWDAKGVMTRAVQDSNGTGKAKDLIAVEYTDYKFDPKGNWTQRTETVTDDKKITEKRVIYRKIIYYGD